MFPVLSLPNEVQLAIIEAALQPTDWLYSADERAALRDDRNFLASTIVHVCKSWHALATPLLYRHLIVDDLKADSQVCTDRTWLLERTLRSRPDLRACARSLHGPAARQPAASDEDEPLFMFFRSAELALPNLTALSDFTIPRQLKCTGYRPKQLQLYLGAAVAQTARNNGLPLGLDTSRIERLEVIIDGPDALSFLAEQFESMPGLVDLRLKCKTALRDNLPAVERLLKIVGPRLLTLHLLHAGALLPIDIPSHCPNLVRLGLNLNSFYAQTPSAKNFDWRPLKLDHLLFGDPDDLRLGESQSEVPGWPAARSLPILKHIAPKRVTFAMFGPRAGAGRHHVGLLALKERLWAEDGMLVELRDRTLL